MNAPKLRLGKAEKLDVVKNNLGKRKVSIQIIKNAKRNRYKRTNQHLYPKPLESFVKRTETKYEMKTKCVLINKEQRAKADKKRRRRRDALI